MKRALTCVAAYGVALIGMVIFFSTTLLNEKVPILPFILCPIVLAVAGYVSAFPDDRKEKNKTFYSWIIWSAVIGVAFAIMFTVSKF